MVFEILNENGKILTLGGKALILLKLVPFYSIWCSKFRDYAIPNFISNFNNHYSDLSKEVYNIFVSQGSQEKIVKNLPWVGVPVGYFFAPVYC